MQPTCSCNRIVTRSFHSPDTVCNCRESSTSVSVPSPETNQAYSLTSTSSASPFTDSDNEDHTIMDEETAGMIRNITAQSADNQHAANEMMTALTATIANGLSLQFLSGSKITPFKGKDSEDIYDFLKRYSRHCTLTNIDADKKLESLLLFLEGSALAYYELLPDRVQNDWRLLTADLKAHFNPPALHQLKRAELYSHKMTPTESLDDHCRYILKHSRMLNLSDREQIHIFVNGIPPVLKEFVLTQNIDTLQNALQSAKIKQAASLTAYGTAPNQDTELLKKINALVHQNATPVIAYQNTVNPPSNLTTDNRPTCYYCHKPGHFASNCYQRQSMSPPPYRSNYSRPSSPPRFSHPSDHRPNYSNYPPQNQYPALPPPHTANDSYNNQQSRYRSDQQYPSDSRNTYSRPYNDRNYRQPYSSLPHASYPQPRASHPSSNSPPDTRPKMVRFHQPSSRPHVAVLRNPDLPRPSINVLRLDLGMYSPDPNPNSLPEFFYDPHVPISNLMDLDFSEYFPTPGIPEYLSPSGAPIFDDTLDFPPYSSPGPDSPTIIHPIGTSHYEYQVPSVLTLTSDNHMFIDSKLCDIPCRMLVDTGASITCLNKKFWLSIPAHLRPTKPPSHPVVVTLNGSQSPTIGEMSSLFQFDTFSITADVHVLDCGPYDVIIGRDFLSKAGAVIDLNNSHITFYDGLSVPLLTEHDIPRSEIHPPESIMAKPIELFTTPISMTPLNTPLPMPPLSTLNTPTTLQQSPLEPSAFSDCPDPSPSPTNFTDKSLIRDCPSPSSSATNSPATSTSSACPSPSVQFLDQYKKPLSNTFDNNPYSNLSRYNNYKDKTPNIHKKSVDDHCENETTGCLPCSNQHSLSPPSLTHCDNYRPPNHTLIKQELPKLIFHQPRTLPNVCNQHTPYSPPIKQETPKSFRRFYQPSNISHINVLNHANICTDRTKETNFIKDASLNFTDVIFACANSVLIFLAIFSIVNLPPEDQSVNQRLKFLALLKFIDYILSYNFDIFSLLRSKTLEIRYSLFDVYKTILSRARILCYNFIKPVPTFFDINQAKILFWITPSQLSEPSNYKVKDVSFPAYFPSYPVNNPEPLTYLLYL